MNINQQVLVSYTNYRGETSDRLIQPIRIWYGSNAWHQEPQWLIDVVDLERRVERTFSMSHIHRWQELAKADHS